MKQKIWLKPVEGSKANSLKSMSEKGGEPALLECLFLDTADADLLHSNIVLAVCAGPDGLSQMAVSENPVDHTADEYTVALPPQGLNISLFPTKYLKSFGRPRETNRCYSISRRRSRSRPG